MPTVLAIDEDTATLDFVRAGLNEAGHSVVTLTSATRAIEVLAACAFDLVLTEVILHDKDGVQAILEIRQRWPGVPIVAMSGGGARLTAHQAVSIAKGVGATETLQKPFSRSDLLWTLDRVWGARAETSCPGWTG